MDLTRPSCCVVCANRSWDFIGRRLYSFVNGLSLEMSCRIGNIGSPIAASACCMFTIKPVVIPGSITLLLASIVHIDRVNMFLSTQSTTATS